MSKEWSILSHAITNEQLTSFQKDLAARPEAPVNERAVTKNGILASSYDWHAQPTALQSFQSI